MALPKRVFAACLWIFLRLVNVANGTCRDEFLKHISPREGVLDATMYNFYQVAGNVISSVDNAVEQDLANFYNFVNLLLSVPKADIKGGFLYHYMLPVSEGGFFSSASKAVSFIPHVLHNNTNEAFASIATNRSTLEKDPWWNPGEQKAYTGWRMSAFNTSLYGFTEKTAAGVPITRRSAYDYYPVHYIFPLEGNEKAVGYDLSSDHVRRIAIKLSEQTFGVVVTGRIVAVQSHYEQYSFIRFYPLYNNRSDLSHFTIPARAPPGSDISNLWPASLISSIYVVEDLLGTSVGDLLRLTPEAGSWTLVLIFQKLGYISSDIAELNEWQFLAGFSNMINASDASEMQTFNRDWKNNREQNLSIVAHNLVCGTKQVDRSGTMWEVIVAVDYGCQPGEILIAAGVPGKLVSKCRRCPVGVSCSGKDKILCGEHTYCRVDIGHNFQMAGYFVELTGANEFSVFLCRNELECIAGPFGSCASGRTGLACDDCFDGYMPDDSSGVCLLCSSSSTSVILALCSGILVLVVLIILTFKVDMTTQRLTYLTVFMTGGQLLTALQAMSAFGELEMGWQGPVKSFFDSLFFLKFDFDALNLACIAGHAVAEVDYVLKLLTYPAAFLVLCLCYFVAKLLKRPFSFDHLINVNGTFLFLAYTSLTLAVLPALECIRNPNETSAMLSHPSILCWQTARHTDLVVLSLLGLLEYPVGIFAWCIWITLKYPARVASSDGLAVNARYNFLFARFSPARYFYGLVLLGRNLFIALIPVALANCSSIALFSMGFILLVGFGVESALLPWRTRESNMSSIYINGALVLILFAVAPLLASPDPAFVTGTFYAILVSLLLGGLLIIGYSIYSRFKPPKFYDAFLSHHKGGAGILCRMIKVLFNKHSSACVFLDSDELESLDLIFDTVRSRTKALVAVISPEFLRRMWCAGEVVMAHRNEIPIVPLYCDSCIIPSDDETGSILSVWTDDQIGWLASFGITLEMVKDAYSFVRSLPALNISRYGSFAGQEGTIIELLDRCCVRNYVFKRAVSDGCQHPAILIAGSTLDVEMISCAYVLKHFVQKVTKRGVKVVRDTRDVVGALESCLYVLVLLSKSVLLEPQFARIALVLSKLETHKVESVTVLSDAGFQFPGVDFFAELQANGRRSLNLGPESALALVHVFRSLCSILALPLSPLGSEGLLEKQVSEICRRFRTIYQNGQFQLAEDPQRSRTSSFANFAHFDDDLDMSASASVAANLTIPEPSQLQRADGMQQQWSSSSSLSDLDVQASSIMAL